MSDSLSFAEHQLARAHLMLRLGRPKAARRLLASIVRHPEQSHRLRADAYKLLAEIDAAAGRWRPARRHLAAAIRLRRHADELYVEYARLVQADPDADPRLAVRAMRRAVGIDPFEPRSWAALGTAAHHASDEALAAKAFRRAARLRPDDPAVLAEVAEGLLALGLDTDARALVTGARFRLNGRADVTAICDRVGFSLAAREQRSAASESTPRIVRFPLRAARSKGTDLPGVILRADTASGARPHLLRLFGRRSDPRRAN